MYDPSYMYSYPNAYNEHFPMYSYGRHPAYWNLPNGAGYASSPNFWPNPDMKGNPVIGDHGKEPFVLNIDQAAKQNNTFRTAIWTGNHLQVVLMSINVGEDIGLEIHPDVDQFLRIEQGQGLVQMGKSKDHLNFVRHVYNDFAIMVPAGTWHNVTNTANIPLKLYTIYAPPEHPFGTVHKTKADAEASEKGYGYPS